MKLGGAVCDSMSWMMGSTNLVLDEELDTLDGGGSRLGDGGGNTTHEEISGEATDGLLSLSGVGNGTHFD